MSSKLSKPAAKAQAKAKAKARKSNYNSPSMQRKAEALSSGKNASVEMTEDVVRAVEGSVLKQLEADKQIKERLLLVQTDTRSALGDYDEARRRLGDLGERLQTLRSGGGDFLAKNKQLFHKADMLQSELGAISGSSLMPQDKKELEVSIKEAGVICKTMDQLGEQRNDILSHVLNGLANVKVAKVQGVKQKPEVLQHLFGLIHESESLEVPHSNAQVRLKHCLQICDRILAAQVKSAQVDAFAAIIKQVEALKLDGEADTSATAPTGQSQ